MIAATEKKSAKRYLFYRKYFFLLPPQVVANFLSRLEENHPIALGYTKDNKSMSSARAFEHASFE
jgi:hypothetical protein